MKNLSCIILMLMCSMAVYGQNQIPQKGEYVKNDKLDKFVGTWEGSKENQTLRIILKKEKVYIKPMDIHMDMIIGWHIYMKNNQVIESSIDFAGSSYDDHNTTILAGDGDSKLSITFNDISRKRNSRGELKLLSDSKSVLTLAFEEQVLINQKPANPTEAIPTPSEWNMKRIE